MLSVLEHVEFMPEGSAPCLSGAAVSFPKMISAAFCLLCRVTWILKQQGRPALCHETGNGMRGLAVQPVGVPWRGCAVLGGQQ